MKGDATYAAIRKSSSVLGETCTATLGFAPLSDYSPMLWKYPINSMVCQIGL